MPPRVLQLIVVDDSTIKTFFIDSLGCAKNTVDSHAITRILLKAGFQQAHAPENSDVIIVNTCGFIQPAFDESVQTLKEYAQKKREHQYLIAAGCLTEREKRRIGERVEGIDAAMSTRRWSDILHVLSRIESAEEQKYYFFPKTDHILSGPEDIPRIAVQGGSAYVKIADGCDRKCAYCTIPLIKGPMVSRKPDHIISDVQTAAAEGAKEIILIAQDTTAYGRDLGYEDGISALLKDLVKIDIDIDWIRLMYTFPGSISEQLIELMAREEKILPYLDIPLQHAHPEVLQRMGRPSNMEDVRDTILKFRNAMPQLALRTTFIIGFPGETDDELNTVGELLWEIGFDHVGFFPYSHEEGAPAYAQEDTISTAEKEARIQYLAGLQQEISLKKNKSFIGEELTVLIEGNGDDVSVGRSYRDAPEIDGLVFVQGIHPVGDFVRTKITGAMIHDLIGDSIL